MNKDKLKLAKDTIRMLLDAFDDTVTESNYVERLKQKKAAVESGEIVWAGLK